MIFSQFSPLEFVSKLMNLLDMQSPECVARPLLCCLPSFFFFSPLCSQSVHPPLEKAADPPGIFVIPSARQRGHTIRYGTPFRVTRCFQDFGVSTGSEVVLVFFSVGSLNLWKSWGLFFIRPAERMKAAGVFPRGWCSVSGPVFWSRW